MKKNGKEIIISIIIAVIILGSILFYGLQRKKIKERKDNNEIKNEYVFNQGTIYEKVDIESICKMNYIGADIFVDEMTGVIYYVNLPAHRMTVLVNEDGKPKNIKDYVSVEEWEKYVKEKENEKKD